MTPRSSPKKTPAREITEQIRATALTAAGAIAQLHALIDEAKAQNVHVTLGFATWGGYLADTLAGSIKLGRDERRELVARLDNEGLSTRVIGEIVGSGKSTVHDDLSTVRIRTVDTDAKVISRDGRERPKHREPRTEPKIETCDMTEDGVVICPPDKSFADAMRITNTFLRNLCEDPTPEQAARLRRLLTTYLDKIERPTHPSTDATLAMLNDLRGPWSRGFVSEARKQSPIVRGHIVAALQSAIDEVKEIGE